MPKTAYRAEFSDGTVKCRKSDRQYAFAWRVVVASGMSEIGFSASRSLAEKAIRRPNYIYISAADPVTFHEIVPVGAA